MKEKPTKLEFIYLLQLVCIVFMSIGYFKGSTNTILFWGILHLVFSFDEWELKRSLEKDGK